jgi:hypothetical protein
MKRSVWRFVGHLALFGVILAAIFSISVPAKPTLADYT